MTVHPLEPGIDYGVLARGNFGAIIFDMINDISFNSILHKRA